MTDDVRTVAPGDSLAETVHRLLEKKRQEGAILVVEDGKLCGILSEINALMYLAGLSVGQGGVDRVDAHMTRGDLVMVGPDVALMRLVVLFETHGIHQVPVVDEDRRLLGMVTLHQVMKALDERVEARAKATEHPTTYDKLRERFGR